MMKKNLLLLLFVSIISLVGCKNDESEEPTVPTGNVAGKVNTINNAKPVGGALVFVFDDEHKLYKTYTDHNGNFVLNAPVGERRLHIQTGDGSNFRTVLNVTVQHDQTVQIDPSLTRLDQVANIAYVPGNYDNIEDIVTDLGYEIDAISYTDLNNYSIVSQYDIIFLNCGSRSGASSSDAAVFNNLAAFVTNGGSLYASDWDVAYLTGGNSNSPGCNQPGGFIPDAMLCSTNNGMSTTITGAQVVSSNLATAIGFTSLDIEYDLGSWQRINSYDSTFWEVLVKNPSNDEALMIKTVNFSDTSLTGNPVGNTSTEWITICHAPQGSTEPPVTLTIDIADWPEHQAHGDVLGSCTTTNNNGTIYYTTFHNHASGNIGNSGLILEYVILNL